MVLDLPPFSKDRVPGEIFFNLYVRLKEDTVYAKAGDEILRKQIPVEGSKAYGSFKKPVTEGTVDVAESERSIAVNGDRIHVIICKDTGNIREVMWDGKHVLSNEQDSFYRAPTGIDEGSGENCYNYAWVTAGLKDPKGSVSDFKVYSTNELVMVKERVDYLDGKISLEKTYEITASGITYTVIALNATDLETLPRIGQTMLLDKELSHVRYYGRGPWENYKDRKSSAFLGIYEADVSGMHVPYVRSCECGGREDTRWLDITDRNGHGIRVTGSDYYHFSALPYSIAQYADADYEEDLGESKGTVLTLDGIHAGLGGDTGWTKNIHPEYRIVPGRYFYSFSLQMI